MILFEKTNRSSKTWSQIFVNNNYLTYLRINQKLYFQKLIIALHMR